MKRGDYEMKHIVMPRMGLTVETGTLVKWHKSVGDIFTEGEVIFEVESDKVTNEIEAQFSGKLRKILVQEGESVPVAEPVAEAEETF